MKLNNHNKITEKTYNHQNRKEIISYTKPMFKL